MGNIAHPTKLETGILVVHTLCQNARLEDLVVHETIVHRLVRCIILEVMVIVQLFS